VVSSTRKFKVFRLSDINQIEPTLNDFSVPDEDDVVIEHVSVSMPDYRVVVLVVQYAIFKEDPQAQKTEAKNDKAAK